jgi:hypothetical protein
MEYDMSFILENYDTILAAVGALLTAASLVTKLTPTPKDDEVVRKVLAFLSFLQPKGAGLLKVPGTPARQGVFVDRTRE